MTQPEPRVPDLLVERYLLGELSADQAHAVAERLAAEPGGRERLAALQASNEHILVQHPAGRVATEIAARARSQADGDWLRIPRRRPAYLTALLIAAPVVPALCALLFIFVFHPTAPKAPSPAETILLKGLQPHLVVWRKTTGGQAEQLANNSRARAGDMLQLSYVAAGAAYGVVISIDGRGTVTQQLPAEGNDAAVLRPDGETALDFSYQLDDAPAFERFIFVTAATPFSAQVVLQAAHELMRGEGSPQTDSVRLPEGLMQSSHLLRK
jgi:anti-sigma factor RsiW